MENSGIILEILKYCQNQCFTCTDENISIPSEKYYADECHNHVYRFIPSISCDELKKILKQGSICDELERTEDEISSPLKCNSSHLKSVIDAFCHPSIITEIKNKFLFNRLK